METENSRLHNPAHKPLRPGLTPQPGQPVGRRPAVDGFTVRRAAPMAATPPHRPTAPARPIQVTGHPATPAPRPHVPQPVATHPVSNDFAPRPATHQAPRTHTPAPQQREFVPEVQEDLDTPKGAKPPKERNETGHSGLVGFIVFIVLGALLVSPFIPGVIMQNFPLSSSNFSTGDQALACIDVPSNVSSTTSYDSKSGSPLNYRYSTTTTQSAVCNGSTQTAVAGYTSQFSPLALLADIAIALVVAIIVTKVWRKIFSMKSEKRSKR